MPRRADSARWGPRPLWPLSDAAWDGWSWADALSQWNVRRRRSRANDRTDEERTSML